MTYVTKYVRSKSDYQQLAEQGSNIAWFHGWFGWTLEEDQWTTRNGYVLNWDDWCTGEPNNYQGSGENCITAHVGDNQNSAGDVGCWNDMNCNFQTYAICVLDETTPAPEQTEDDCREDETFHSPSGSCWKKIGNDYFHVSRNVYSKAVASNYCRGIANSVFAARYESAVESTQVFDYLKSRSNFEELADQGHPLAAYQGWFGYVRAGEDFIGEHGDFDIPDDAWCNGEPNNYGGGENCVVGQVEGRTDTVTDTYIAGRCFNDMYCGYKTHAMCEYRG